ncbi:hypothetical protein CAPTEDRAFT_189959 [Capitella teleta]|uniref:Transient receptor ion channel domain-containing protein n=1 Tax=Capitella teleta TaxID=283909 RepID=R7U524_CAPTE|nr:hypothetical protein CAPTEDRAFT_189959 [Capitella teleta]|eukprot:ELT98255.1 hypothetical protein CAPTEDRAFT_189959 [Capitella teleta]
MKEYLNLVEVCMNFAYELMDLCRGTQEVEAVLGEENTGNREPLARLRLAIHYNEKKFVAHPNCQQHLTNIWYGKEMSSLQSMSTWKKSGLLLLFIPALPLVTLIYVINSNTRESAFNEGSSKSSRSNIERAILET